ncbi:NUDIX domain-containing protein [Streptomyces sp. NPDC003832]
MTEHPAPHAGWRRLRTQVLHRGRVLSFRRDDVIQPDGSPSTYEYVAMPDGARVIAVNGRGEVALVEDAFYLHGRRMLHAPGGAVQPGEAPERAAARECAEESGLIPGTLRRLTRFHPLPTSTAASTHVFLATDLTSGPTRRDLSESAMTTTWLALPDAIDAVHDGTITEAGTVIGLLLVAADAARDD